MGFFNDVFDTVFGGEDTSAQDAQIKANQRAQDYIESQAKLARSDASRLFNRGRGAAGRGYQKALGTTKTSTVDALRSMALGNQRAQASLLSGMPMYRDAILGAPVDMSRLRSHEMIPSGAMDRLLAAQMPLHNPASLAGTGG